MYEEALKILWPESVTSYTGRDLVDNIKANDKVTILENILLTNVGDKIKTVFFDRDGKILVEEQKKVDQYESMQGIGQRKEPSYSVLY